MSPTQTPAASCKIYRERTTDSPVAAHCPRLSKHTPPAHTHAHLAINVESVELLAEVVQEVGQAIWRELWWHEHVCEVIPCHVCSLSVGHTIRVPSHLRSVCVRLHHAMCAHFVRDTRHRSPRTCACYVCNCCSCAQRLARALCRFWTQGPHTNVPHHVVHTPPTCDSVSSTASGNFAMCSARSTCRERHASGDMNERLTTDCTTTTTTTDGRSGLRRTHARS